MTDLLAKPCDACGKPIGGGYNRCPRCNIYLCWYCGYVSQTTKREVPAKCPMCGGEMDR